MNKKVLFAAGAIALLAAGCNSYSNTTGSATNQPSGQAPADQSTATVQTDSNTSIDSSLDNIDSQMKNLDSDSANINQSMDEQEAPTNQ